MMQRNFIRLACCSGIGRGVFMCSPLLRNEVEQGSLQHQKVEEIYKNYQMKPMSSHSRSTYEYKGSSKGAEVGARNEAAFMNYEPFTPHTLSKKLVMPGLINLLTVTPLYCALLCIGAVAWGIFYWDEYCQRNYETVLIARPTQLK